MDGLTDEDADREAERSDRRESVGLYIYAGTGRRKKRKVLDEGASLKLRTVSSCIYVL